MLVVGLWPSWGINRDPLPTWWIAKGKDPEQQKKMAGGEQHDYGGDGLGSTNGKTHYITTLRLQPDQ